MAEDAQTPAPASDNATPAVENTQNAPAAPQAPAQTPAGKVDAPTTNEPVEQNAPTAPVQETESASEDAAEGSEEPAGSENVDASPQTETTQAPVAANGSQVQPVQVKEALSSLHSELDSLVTKFKNSEVAAMHDVTDVVNLLESAKEWVVDKVEQYDPALAASLK